MLVVSPCSAITRNGQHANVVACRYTDTNQVSSIGRGRISQFIENLVRPHVVNDALAVGYAQMADSVENERPRQSRTETPSDDFDVTQ